MRTNIILLVCFLSSLLVGLCICDDDEEDYNHVLDECNHKLRHIDSISKFETFMKHYKALDKDRKRPKKGILGSESRLKKCYALEEALLELERLVEARSENHVCQLNYIERLVEFHLKYLTRDKDTLDGQNSAEAKPVKEKSKPKSSYVGYFFSLYAHQIAYNCKSKLTSRVQEAQDHHDCLSILFTFMPSIFEPTSSEDQDAEDLSEAEKFLDEFKRVESYAPIIKFKNSPKIPEAYFDAAIPEGAVEKIESLKAECRVREPYYKALFAPIATLAHLGYSVDESTSDSSDLNDFNTRLLKCWLATAQLCEGILRTHLNIAASDEPDTTSKFISIRWGSLPTDDQNALIGTSIINEIDLNDTVEEISPEIIKLVKKKFTGIGKIKRKAFSWAKSFVERHINLEAIQREASKNFLDALASVDNGVDSKVAFNGKKFDNKKFNPVTVITDDADFAVQLTSSFWNKEIGLLVSSVIAITMSAVFVWFSLYALANSLKHHYFAKDVDSNVRSGWRKIRDGRVKNMESKLKKKKATDYVKVYKPI